jgi:predicted RNA-binding Zn-ribbon protein involved in translation (DUF1610 family)
MFTSGEAPMAIKRPTKSRGMPSHKPVASAPLRHVDVRAPQQMVPGEVYVGWLCKNRSCGRVMAIAATAPGSKALTEVVDQLTAIKCPHCGDENLYRWSDRSEQKYTPKSMEI